MATKKKTSTTTSTKKATTTSKTKKSYRSIKWELENDKSVKWAVKKSDAAAVGYNRTGVMVENQGYGGVAGPRYSSNMVQNNGYDTAPHDEALSRTVGGWGEAITFYVNAKKQVVMRNMAKSVSARWKEHEIIGKTPLSEFAGPDIQTVTMSVIFSSTMKIKPRAALNKLEKAIKKGTVEYLYIGGKKVGAGKMKLTSMSEAWDTLILDGKLVKATVDLTFSEYITKKYKHGKKVLGTKVPWEFLAGESAKFLGGKVFKKANDTKGAKKKDAVNVKVVKFEKGKKHPYYVESIVSKKASENYKKQVEELQKKLKTAKRSEKKAIQESITTLNTAKKANETVWKGWVDDGTLKTTKQ